MTQQNIPDTLCKLFYLPFKITDSVVADHLFKTEWNVRMVAKYPHMFLYYTVYVLFINEISLLSY